MPYILDINVEVLRHTEDKFRKYSGQFRARLPKSLHAELARRAEIEGVSLNTLAIALLAKGLAKPSDIYSAH